MADAPPPDIPRLEDCIFYHVMDLPGVGTVDRGAPWDLRGRFEDYTGHVPMAGKTVLDVGAASGFLTFEAEARGATVISFDAASGADYQYLPIPATAPETDAPNESARRHQGLTNSYWFAHAHHRSRARAIYGTVYQLAALVPACDVVLVGQILVHLRDPLEALRQASLVARQTLVITEGSFEAEQPLAVFLGPGHYYAWWHYSVPLYSRWLDLLGFRIERAEKNLYRCRHPHATSEVELWTFVAHRRPDV